MRYLLLLLSALPVLGGELNTLTPEEKDSGWKLLFNGKDLENWRLYGSDQPPRGGWEIKDGILTKKDKQSGGQIVTLETYENYIFSWEWRITKEGNSGIKYLVTEDRPKSPGPEYQLIDNDGKQAAAGPKHFTASLYDIIPPAEDAPFRPVGEWNQSKIVVAGNNVEHWLNGTKVLHYELGSSELKSAIEKSKFKNEAGFGEKIKGHIMLTDHNTECSFRNFKILETSAE